MAELRRIDHPGPPAAERITAIPCRATRRRVCLRPGLSMLDAMTAAVDGAPAWFDLAGVPTERLRFVQPAPAPGDGRAAWYSATSTLEGGRILRAGAHLGLRDSAPFAHVHGLWAGREDRVHMGHLLNDQTVVGDGVEVDAWMLEGARMETFDDAETGFSLFRPVVTRLAAAPDALLATARPNQILDGALLGAARGAGMGHATVKGIGSLIGTRFAERNGLDSYATEVLLTNARIDGGQVALSAASVGFDGAHGEGSLAHALNTICVTFEFLMLADP